MIYASVTLPVMLPTLFLLVFNDTVLPCREQLYAGNVTDTGVDLEYFGGMEHLAGGCRKQLRTT